MLGVVIVLFGSLLTVSCSKETEQKSTESIFQVSSTKMLLDRNLIDQCLIDLARIVGEAQENAGFREILLSEAKLNIASESAVVYGRIKNKEIIGLGVSVGNYLAEVSSSLGFEYDSAFFNCTLVSNIPRLCFNLHYTSDSLEVDDIETWGEGIVFPAVLPFEEQEEFEIQGYGVDDHVFDVNNYDEPEDQMNFNGEVCSYYIA